MVGQQLAAAAGWDPGALANILGTMEREQGLQGNTPRGMSFLASHPTTPERVANTTEYAKALQRAPSDPICPTRAALLARLDGLVVGQGAAAGVIIGQTFLHPDLDFFIRFPPGWTVQNGRNQVGAVSPDHDALVLLEAVGKGDDPVAGARALERASGSPVVQNTKPATIGGLKAARTRAHSRTESGEVALEFTWIAYAGRIYEILGVTPVQRSETFRPVYDDTVQTFRSLQPAERASIREDRLRIFAARQDETLSALVKRAKGSWNVAMTAVVNDLSVDTPLQPESIKIAVAEPYASPRSGE